MTETANASVKKEENPPSALAQTLGEAAFANRELATSRFGQIAFRNMLRTAVGVIPTAMAFVAARYFNKHYNEAAHLTGGIHKYLKPIMKNPLSQQALFIWGGFTAFRTSCRMWQRGYDRIFAEAPDASTAMHAIDKLPENAMKDMAEILPAEMIGNVPSAFVLGSVKMHYKHPEPALEGNFAQAHRGFPNEWAASVAAYLPFFELNDRMYDDISGGKDTPDYYMKLQGKTPHPEPDAKEARFGFFTEDGIGRVAFRRVGSLVVGLAPYFYLQRLSRAAIGEVAPGTHSVMTNLVREYCNYATFAAYTGTSEAYNMAYDDLFKKLEKKYSGQNQSAGS